MKAIVQDEYGGPEVMALADVDKPAPEDGAVLVRVRATSANPADWHIMRGEPQVARLSFGLRRPKWRTLGCDVAGEVEAVGANAKAKPGDEVYANTFMRGFGGFAEFASVPEDVLVPKPPSLSFEQAAAVPIAGLTALQGLRDHGEVRAGKKVLMVGAAGGVGTFAVQIAKALGGEVTGVCSTGKVDLVRSLGADHVIDYTQDDFTEGGERYDVIFQLAGTTSPSACRRALTSDGTLLLSSGESQGHFIGPLGRVIKANVLSPFVGQKLKSFTVETKPEDLRALSDLIGAGEVKPVIDRTYSLAEVPEAIRYLEDGHARGKVVIGV